MRETAGVLGALIAAAVLAASPGTLLLSFSVMQEVPAMSLSLAALYLTLQGTRTQSQMLMLLAGSAFAVAVQIKLTAVLFLPGAFVVFWQSGGLNSQKARRLFGIYMGGAFLIALSAIAVFLGRGSFDSSWLAHTAASPKTNTFDSRLLLLHWDSIGVATLALIFALKKGRFREIAVPCVLLLTDSLIHATHRPWWNYYYLHVSVPVSWLVGWGVIRLLETTNLVSAPQATQPVQTRILSQIAVCLAVATLLAHSERRLESTIQDLRARPTVYNNPVLQRMSEYAANTRWAYSESPIHAFHAGLKVPPELAVITLKRQWSGQITPQQIRQGIQHYDPELILLRVRDAGTGWEEFLRSNYEWSVSDSNCNLFVSKRLLAAKSKEPVPH